MANSIEFAKNYTGILDEGYQRAAVSRCLNSGGRMVRAAQRQGDSHPEDIRHGARGLHPQRGLQDGQHHIIVRDVRLRLRAGQSLHDINEYPSRKQRGALPGRPALAF